MVIPFSQIHLFARWKLKERHQKDRSIESLINTDQILIALDLYAYKVFDTIVIIQPMRIPLLSDKWHQILFLQNLGTRLFQPISSCVTSSISSYVLRISFLDSLVILRDTSSLNSKRSLIPTEVRNILCSR